MAADAGVLSPDMREAVLHGLAMIHATRQELRVDIPYEGADRVLVPMALAGIADALLDHIEALGGDAGEVLRTMYGRVTGG